MSKKKLEEKSESVVVDVANDVTSKTTDVSVESEPSVELPASPKRKRSSSKKVADVALLSQISEMEVALESAKDAIAAAAADNERLADELGVSVAENKSLRKELTKCKQDFKKVQGDNRANSALVEELHNQLVRKDVQYKELTDTISRLQSKIKQYADEADSAAADLTLVRGENDVLSARLSNFESMNFWGRLKYLFCVKKV